MINWPIVKLNQVANAILQMKDIQVPIVSALILLCFQYFYGD